MVERAVALARSEEITADDLPEKIGTYRSTHVVVGGEDPSEFPSLDEVERRYIVRVLETTGGSRTRAARVLGLARKTLYRRLLQYGIPTTGGERRTDPRAGGGAAKNGNP